MTVLRKEHSTDNSRPLSAALKEASDLLIESLDSGQGVKNILGTNEYEWVWIIKVKNAPIFTQASGAEGDVLRILAVNFKAKKAAN